MKKIIFSSIIAIALLTSCGSDSAKHNTDSISAPAATSTTPSNGTQMAAAKYQCPMKCEGEKTYDKPGKCPMCQMDMKEVK